MIIVVILILIQIIKLPGVRFPDTGISEMSQIFEKLRSVSSRTAAMPNIEIYRSRLDPSLAHLCGSEQIGNTGGRSDICSGFFKIILLVNLL